MTATGSDDRRIAARYKCAKRIRTMILQVPDLRENEETNRITESSSSYSYRIKFTSTRRSSRHRPRITSVSAAATKRLACNIQDGNTRVQQVPRGDAGKHRFSIFDSSPHSLAIKLRAKCARLAARRCNDLKSVTDCFKHGLALSAAALAPENCLALFPRATHLIKHARAPPVLSPFSLSLFRVCPPSSRYLLSRSRAREQYARKLVYTYVCACVRTYTGARPRYARFTFPFCFPFPASSFPLVALQHLSLTPVPLSSFAARENESLYLPFFLRVARARFLSFSPAGPSADLSVPFSSRLPPMLPSLSGLYRFLCAV